MKSILINLIAGMGMLLLFPQVGSAQWVQTSGPGVGWVYALTVNGLNFFAGTNQGVFLSTNNGTSWTAVNSGLTNVFIRSLVFSGSNLFAGTYGGGVFLSTNNGNSWAAVNSGLSVNDTVMALAVSGTNIFAGTYRGIFLSTNNGASWTEVNSGLPADTLHRHIYSLAVSGSNVFAGPLGGGVYLSTNNGTSWTAVNNGLPATPTVFALAVNGINLFAGSDYGVFLSTDNGTSWAEINSGFYSTKPWVFSFAVSGDNLFASTEGGVYLFNAVGNSWASVNGALPTTGWGALVVDTLNLFAGTNSYVWRRPLYEMIPPNPPQLLSPANGTANVTVSPAIRWNNATGASTYRLQVSTASDFSSTVKDSSGIVDSAVNLSSLSNNTLYYWRVNATSSGGTSGWSVTYTFTTIVSLPAPVTLLAPADASELQTDSVLLLPYRDTCFR
jgi:ligand-binding sensor domain-containing protein